MSALRAGQQSDRDRNVARSCTNERKRDGKPPAAPAAPPDCAPSRGRLFCAAKYGPYRSNNDLLSYGLTVRVDPTRRHISGANIVRFRMLEDATRIQLDLYAISRSIESHSMGKQSNTHVTQCRLHRLPGDASQGAGVHGRDPLLRHAHGDRTIRRIHVRDRSNGQTLDYDRERRTGREPLVA